MQAIAQSITNRLNHDKTFLVEFGEVFINLQKQEPNRARNGFSVLGF